MSRAPGQPSYPIRAVSRLTGISIDTLRAWERRYAAVSPQRDQRGRLYSDADVGRLRLLQDLVSAGHSIGSIAHLPDGELSQLVPSVATPGAAPAVAPVRFPAALDGARLATALSRLDTAAVDREFSRLAAVLPPVELVRDVLLPALRDQEHHCHRPGGIAHQHLISSTMRHLLGSFLRLHARHDVTTRLLFATLAGDRHEVGILCAAMLAASSGFGISYVGPDLPATEIVEAVRSSQAQTLVLGITLVSRAKRQADELRTLMRGLPPEVEVWAGGQAVAGYADILHTRGGLALRDFDDYHHQLVWLHSRAL